MSGSPTEQNWPCSWGGMALLTPLSIKVTQTIWESLWDLSESEALRVQLPCDVALAAVHAVAGFEKRHYTLKHNHFKLMNLTYSCKLITNRNVWRRQRRRRRRKCNCYHHSVMLIELLNSIKHCNVKMMWLRSTFCPLIWLVWLVFQLVPIFPITALGSFTVCITS